LGQPRRRLLFVPRLPKEVLGKAFPRLRLTIRAYYVIRGRGFSLGECRVTFAGYDAVSEVKGTHAMGRVFALLWQL